MTKHASLYSSAAYQTLRWQRGLWLTWLLFRLLVIPAAISLLYQQNWLGIAVWHAIWLVPALLVTWIMWRGRDVYLLVLISTLMLIYLAESGYRIFEYGFNQAWVMMAAYSIDSLLLLAINITLFILLKRLPKMNQNLTTDSNTHSGTIQGQDNDEDKTA